MTVRPTGLELDDLDRRPGYALKRADVALRRAMEGAVGPHGLTLAQYACLELVARAPGASAAELARGAFVTRQAAHQVVRQLLDAGLVARRAARAGRALELHPTPAGERRRAAAAGAVLALEARMTGALGEPGRDRLVDALRAVSAALEA